MKKNVKKKKVTVRASRKRGKSGLSDALKAFLLVGILVVSSVCISIAIISIHSRKNNSSGVIEENIELTVPVAIENAASEVVVPYTSPPVNISAASGENIQQNSQVRSDPAVSSKIPERTIKSSGSIVFVIDDAGNNLRELEPFLLLPFPVTIAVLPGLPYSAEAARRIRAAGKEVFLHQPMEAVGARNPGPGAVYSGMNAQEIRSILKRNIEEVGPVAGINNHQGSKITADIEAVETILAFCSENSLFFLDSRTTAETVVPSRARLRGMKIAERDVFIDNEQDRDSMLNYITSGLAKAQKNGSAVMIGHTWSPLLAPLLAEQVPDFIKQGYTIRNASDIIRAK
jgi:polysaccharide deacetylase 2 family uncharacterized protein YibQ